MSRYQQAPHQDNGGGYGQSYNQGYGNGAGNAGGNGNYGGYSDEPAGGYGDGGYGKYGGNGAAAGGASDYPMSSSNPYASAASPGGYAPKTKRNKWLWIGIPVLLLIIIGAVLGGVLGTQLNKGNRNSGNTSSGAGSGSGSGSGQTVGGGNVVPSGVSSVNTAQLTNTAANRYLAVATDTYRLPVYATGTNTAAYAAPTSDSSLTGNSWPSDNASPSNTTLRPHPRLIAPQYKWDALRNGLIAQNPYFEYWNRTIIANATSTLNDPAPEYIVDGESGVLDVAREIKLKVKNWAYAYRMTGNTQFADRVWLELYTASGNNSDVSFGPNDSTRWNPSHFLDVAEFAAAFAIGYDWCYDFFTADRRSALRWTMINLALNQGLEALNGGGQTNWWAAPGGGTPVNGNWNCVINGGLTLAALAIRDEDPTGTVAAAVIERSVPNARANCFLGAASDGSWSEGPNYWYFGTNAAGELSSSLATATGNDWGLARSNPGFEFTSLYHMHVQGMTSLFNYGDHGPNKFSTTANSLMYWSTVFNTPRYALYQRDRSDSAEPFSMFWYDPAVAGTWWDDLELDRHFPDTQDEWAAARSGWATNDGTYWAMKGGLIPGHQNHLDMDIGDFVVDAMGQRWFGELGSGQYLADGYFNGEADQNGTRWRYYRKRTEGQNTLQINAGNQLVSAAPSAQFDSTGTRQGAAPSLNVSTTDTAFFSLDMSSAYGNGATVRRGIRYLNGRRQILIQDDVSGVASGSVIQWRAHTNATVTLNGATATLALGGQTLIASLPNAASGVVFSTASPTRQANGPPPSPPGTAQSTDMPNPGVTVLRVERTSDGSAWSNQVLLNPQWSGMASSSFVSPAAVPVASWSLTSHN